MALAAAREGETLPGFSKEYPQRAGNEEPSSAGVRTQHLRRSRYIGSTQTHLQHVPTAAAINVIRLGRWSATGAHCCNRPCGPSSAFWARLLSSSVGSAPGRSSLVQIGPALILGAREGLKAGLAAILEQAALIRWDRVSVQNRMGPVL